MVQHADKGSKSSMQSHYDAAWRTSLAAGVCSRKSAGVRSTADFFLPVSNLHSLYSVAAVYCAQELVQLNHPKVHEKWRKLMREAKSEDLKKEIQGLADAHARMMQHKQNVIQVQDPLHAYGRGLFRQYCKVKLHLLKTSRLTCVRFNCQSCRCLVSHDQAVALP